MTETAIATAQGREVVLEAERLKKAYETKTLEPIVALEALDFEVFRGEFVALVGPSGCGKSTLLSLIGGLLAPSEGELTYCGQRIDGPRPEIGMMFQAPVLFPWRTTLENIFLPIDVKKESRSDHRGRALSLLETVGLTEFADRYPGELSGGMQQRTALCRLLLQDPDVLLLDEPFGALDEFTREAMNLELLSLWDGTGKTVILVTHNIQEALFLSDRVFVMSPRPGRLTCVVESELQHPREIAMMHSRSFQDSVFEVRRLLGVA